MKYIGKPCSGKNRLKSEWKLSLWPKISPFGFPAICQSIVHFRFISFTLSSSMVLPWEARGTRTCKLCVWTVNTEDFWIPHQCKKQKNFGWLLAISSVWHPPTILVNLVCVKHKMSVFLNYDHKMSCHYRF